jgi:hypothetical protein
MCDYLLGPSSHLGTHKSVFMLRIRWFPLLNSWPLVIPERRIWPFHANFPGLTMVRFRVEYPHGCSSSKLGNSIQDTDWLVLVITNTECEFLRKIWIHSLQCAYNSNDSFMWCSQHCEQSRKKQNRACIMMSQQTSASPHITYDKPMW